MNEWLQVLEQHHTIGLAWAQSKDCARPHSHRPCSVRHTLPNATFVPASKYSTQPHGPLRPSQQQKRPSCLPFVPTAVGSFSAYIHKQTSKARWLQLAFASPSPGTSGQKHRARRKDLNSGSGWPGTSYLASTVTYGVHCNIYEVETEFPKLWLPCH